MRIGIVGGGIGGLAAGVALGQLAGVEVLVLERAGETTSVGRGAALLVWSNAVAVLDRLGLGAQVRERGRVLDQTEFRSPRGGLLNTLPVGTWSEEAGAPTVVIRRPDLLDLLAAARPASVEVRTGAAVASFEARGASVRVSLEDGTALEVDGLVGADGIHSMVRRQLIGDAAPQPAGYDAWVGITALRPSALREGVAVATVGHGPRFWTAILADGNVFWYATLPKGTHASTREELLTVFGAWHDPVGALIRATADDAMVRTRIAVRQPADRWGRGRVTLLGDAAHPSTPDLGQGACQAIESAGVLAQALASSRDVESAFRRYEERRIPHTSAVSRLCWLTAKNSTSTSLLACTLRDTAMRVGLVPVAHASMKWILAGQP